MTALDRIRIGTAGWAIPPAAAPSLPQTGSGLERYAAGFDAVEINSTFYKTHRPATLERWAAAVPASFRFAVKVPKEITHGRRLVGAEPALGAFVESLAPFAEQLGPLLVQLPPSLEFDAGAAGAFFTHLRTLTDGAVVCEPRHPSWFEPGADALLAKHGIARVAADPARTPAAAEAGGDLRLLYVRLHGSPRMYYSSYDGEALARVAAQLIASPAAEAWCIFDNTASGAAMPDALRLKALLSGGTAAPI